MSSPEAHFPSEEEEEARADASGRGPISRRWWLIGGLGCLAMLAGVAWFALSASVDRVRWQTASYEVVDASTVEVGFGVQRPAGVAVTCTIKAMDSRFGAVGLLDVEFPAGPRTALVESVTLRTTAPAVTGVIDRCWPS